MLRQTFFASRHYLEALSVTRVIKSDPLGRAEQEKTRERPRLYLSSRNNAAAGLETDERRAQIKRHALITRLRRPRALRRPSRAILMDYVPRRRFRRRDGRTDGRVAVEANEKLDRRKLDWYSPAVALELH